MAIKLQALIEKLAPFGESVNSATDPSRSEFDRRLKHDHRIVVTGYRDKWMDIEHPLYDKALRLADNQPGDDEVDYRHFNEGVAPLARPFPDSLKPDQKQTIKANGLNFATICKLHGDGLAPKTWKVDNGGIVKSELKVTYSKGNVVKTSRYHITVIKPSGHWEYYKQDKSGNFKREDYGRFEMTGIKESFQAGRIELADESVFRITEEQAAALNDYISEMHITEEKLDLVVENIKTNSDILFSTIELAMASKE